MNSKKGLSVEFESMPKNELSSLLEKFYTEVRQENGQLYKKSTLKDLKHQGFEKIKHYPPLEKVDLVKLHQYFDLNNNVKLQEKVFLDTVL
ncbi:hypothetical protein KUTeg_020737 [Tegillarca granosa]|uniref:Uncharacterized protein n=1 Tax=Tegillarca granosa TaxID=220873 RepID=A0ABQ9EE40_TEGGR|nr:hypothetical protein KUTeg_020737 [Tegillarca granosa]